MIVAAALAGLALQVPAIAIEPKIPAAQTASIAAFFVPEVQFWGKSIETWAGASDLDPNLVAVVMQIESCGDPSAVSSAGAMGLFQVMPYHFTTADDPFDPDTNALRGLSYLSDSLAAAEGDIGLALAGYNGGIGLIPEPEWDWPAETQRYSQWGTGIYADAKSGASLSPRLTEWLSAGGQAMCEAASERLQRGE
jgi:soluble lytic murein transglycosylase-like protein